MKVTEKKLPSMILFVFMNGNKNQSLEKAYRFIDWLIIKGNA